MEQNPFFRPETTTARMLEGWVAEPFGAWCGRAAVLAYDPRRHDVLVLRNRARHDVLDALVEAGWEPQVCDGRRWVWVRLRLAAAQDSRGWPRARRRTSFLEIDR